MFGWEAENLYSVKRSFAVCKNHLYMSEWKPGFRGILNPFQKKFHYSQLWSKFPPGGLMIYPNAEFLCQHISKRTFFYWCRKKLWLWIFASTLWLLVIRFLVLKLIFYTKQHYEKHLWNWCFNSRQNLNLFCIECY